MAAHSPLARIKETFGGKDKLIDKIVNLIDKGDESKEDLRKRLMAAANTKLLRLFAVWSEVKEKYGSKEKLVAAVADKLGRAKDNDYVQKLAKYTPARLIDMAHAAEARARKAGKKAA